MAWKEYTEKQIEQMFAVFSLQDEESRQRFLSMKRPSYTCTLAAVEQSDNTSDAHDFEEQDRAQLESPS